MPPRSKRQRKQKDKLSLKTNASKAGANLGLEGELVESG